MSHVKEKTTDTLRKNAVTSWTAEFTGGVAEGKKMAARSHLPNSCWSHDQSRLHEAIPRLRMLEVHPTPGNQAINQVTNRSCM